MCAYQCPNPNCKAVLRSHILSNCNTLYRCEDCGQKFCDSCGGPDCCPQCSSCHVVALDVDKELGSQGPH